MHNRRFSCLSRRDELVRRGLRLQRMAITRLGGMHPAVEGLPSRFRLKPLQTAAFEVDPISGVGGSDAGQFGDAFADVYSIHEATSFTEFQVRPRYPAAH